MTYVSPKATLMVFSNEKIIAASGCSCQTWGQTNVLSPSDPAYDPDCEGKSLHASENPVGIPAPEW